MQFRLPTLRYEEKITLQLRALYEEQGYQLYRMGSFEEYDLYMQNRSFLTGEDIISFTGADGRLLALKPDVTLSIVKNTHSGATRRVYYTENVYRRSRQNGEYKEISQMGLEFIGGEGAASEAEVLLLAAQSLAAIGEAALDLSHMEFIEAMLAPFGYSDEREMALSALRDKSPHRMRVAAELAALPEKTTEKLVALANVSSPFQKALEQARQIAQGVPGTRRPLDELETLYHALEKAGAASSIRLDFSILNDTAYYNGLIFQGYINGIPRPILSGGRYDNLMHRFDKIQGAIGFALYLDSLGGLTAGGKEPAQTDSFLNIALPKGRLGKDVYKLFEESGLSCQDLLEEESRKLIFEDTASSVRFYLVKPTDVHIYVEHGVADIGIVGKDILSESDADVLELLDLRLGICRLSVAGPAGFTEDLTRPLRVATKYPGVARRHYASKSRPIELIRLSGSIELAPLIGLSDVIVDIVQTGSTLKENNLAVLEDIETSSARLVANRASWRFKEKVIRNLIERVGENLT